MVATAGDDGVDAQTRKEIEALYAEVDADIKRADRAENSGFDHASIDSVRPHALRDRDREADLLLSAADDRDAYLYVPDELSKVSATP